MKDQVLRIEYFTLTVEDRPGVGALMGKQLARENVNLLGIVEIPAQSGKVQVDIVPENPEAFTRATRKIGLTLSEPKLAFLVQGSERPGIVNELLDQLGTNGINVTTMIGISAGDKRYGALIFVDQAAIEQATRALGANVAAHHI